MKKLFFLIFLSLIFGCTQNSDLESAKNACISACNTSNLNLTNGPCLSNEIIPNWVCDVVHNPRTAVDNLAENQCSAFLVSANHFIEVDTECNFIRAY